MEMNHVYTPPRPRSPPPPGASGERARAGSLYSTNLLLY